MTLAKKNLPESMTLLGGFLAKADKNKGANGSIVTGSKRVPVKDSTPTLISTGISKKENQIIRKGKQSGAKSFKIEEVDVWDQASKEAGVSSGSMSAFKFVKENAEPEELANPPPK